VQKRQVVELGLFLGGTPVAEVADKLGVSYTSAWRYTKHELRDFRLANGEGSVRHASAAASFRIDFQCSVAGLAGLW